MLDFSQELLVGGLFVAVFWGFWKVHREEISGWEMTVAIMRTRIKELEKENRELSSSK